MDAITYILHLFDPSEDKTYSITLGQNDYERALRDMNFAQSLLKAAQAEEAKREAVQSEVPRDSEHTAEPAECTSKENSEAASSAITNFDNEAINGNIEENVQSEMDEEEQEHRTIWSYNATVALITSMETHFENLNHATKRKYVFANCSNDLVSAGHQFDASACQRKWKSLVRSYKSAKDHKVKTGRGPSRFLFFDFMDGILGNKPINKCDHTIESTNLENNETETETSEDTHEKKEEAVPTKRSNKSESCAKARSESDRKKATRHTERMAMEAKKVAVEERKVALLEQLVGKKKEGNATFIGESEVHSGKK